MSVVAELDSNLQALRELKPPGVTKSRITAITSLCLDNVESESVLVQKIFTHFKRTPATHKLGVLYVVDSVTRQWVDKARLDGQALTGSSVQDGTYAAGVQKMTELLPTLMNDIIRSAPEDQITKIEKLVDIWERSNTFPASLLTDFKTKLKARPRDSASATPAENRTETRPTSTAPPAQPTPATTAAPTLPLQSAWPPVPVTQASSALPSSFLPAALQAVAPTQQAPYTQPQAANRPEDVLARALQTVIPLHVQQDPVAMQRQIQTLQQLAAMNVPQEQWPAVIAALNAQQVQPAAQTTLPAPTSTFPAYGLGGLNAIAPQSTTQPDAGLYRSRSRSPSRRDGYGTQASGNGYRQRSPISGHGSGPPPTKWLETDPSLPQGHIKVLSRTLFVGGATSGEADIREIFSKYGKVQTVIAQPEKRHAFVKMCTRAEAVNAKDQMADIRDPSISSKVRSTRWGVGFGPRDCSDYTTGISIIPIERLTDADKKWVVTAEYGGTGGKPLVSGLVMEEPDIEIGAGVSSKAISRRVGASETNRRGPGAGGPGGNGGGRGRRDNGRPQDQGQSGGGMGGMGGMPFQMPNFGS